MSNTSSNFEMAGILLGKEVRKRKTPQKKIAIIQQTIEPGMTVSHVARLHGIQPSLLFKWKKQYQEGSLTAVAAGEDVVPASELAAAINISCLLLIKGLRPLFVIRCALYPRPEGRGFTAHLITSARRTASDALRVFLRPEHRKQA